MISNDTNFCVCMWCACLCACSHMWGCKDTNENTYMDVRSWDSVSSSVALHSIYWGRVSSLNPELYTSNQSTKLPGFRDLSVPPKSEVTGHVTMSMGIYVSSGDLNSGPQNYMVDVYCRDIHFFSLHSFSLGHTCLLYWGWGS